MSTAVTEPTPEERASQLVVSWIETPGGALVIDMDRLYGDIASLIRQSVEAERERCDRVLTDLLHTMERHPQYNEDDCNGVAEARALLRSLWGRADVRPPA